MEAESTLQVSRLDLELTHDPLFRKATAKFDERGAKGLAQNVSKLANSSLEVMFYTGACESVRTSSVASVYKDSRALALAREVLGRHAFEEFSSKKINDYIIDYKHEKLKMEYPLLDLTPFAVAQNAFSQVPTKGEAMVDSVNEEEWIAKLNNERLDDELSLFGTTGTQETGFDEVKVAPKVVRAHQRRVPRPGT